MEATTKRALIHVPELEPHCNSWVVSRKNGVVLGEFWNRANVERFNPDTCFVETTAQYLARFNAEQKRARHGWSEIETSV